MKTKIFKPLLIALVSTFAVSASAQDTSQREQKTAKEMAAVETESISARVNNLTLEQTEKLTEINQDFFEKKQEAKDRHATEEEFKLLYKNRENSVKLILNTEQFNSWKDNPVARKIQEAATKSEEINQKK